MPSSLSRVLFRPAVWIIAAVALVALDLFAAPGLAVYVLALFLLPLAWRMLHRRYVAKLTALLMVAVAVPGAVHAIGRELNREPSHTIAANELHDPHPWPIEPARLWTLASLAAAGLFHGNLQRDRRRRLTLRQELQRRVRRRTNQVQRANRALRNEVSLRQETEHLLDRSENRFKALMDRMQLQVTRKNLDGVIIYANETFCRNLGVTAADVIGRTDADLFPAGLALAYRDDDLRVMSSGQAVDQVEEHPGLKGKPGFVQVFKAPEYDKDGRCSGVQIIFWDITQKHRAEIALRDSEARKRALFEASRDAMLLVDAQGLIVEANPSAAELFHLDPSKFVGRRLDEIAVPVDRRSPMARSIASHAALEATHNTISWANLTKAKRHEMKLARADGSTFDSEVTVHTIPVGSHEGMAILVRDVTLRRRAFETLQNAKAAAEAANRTKTEFMAGVSHELRTPLGGITGLAELLAGSPLSQRDRQYVDLIRHSASLLSDVIEDILDFAAIEAGRLQIIPTPIDLHQVVAEAYECVSSRAVEKPLRLVLVIDPHTPRYLIADAKRIRQIVINLAGNAVKFTSLGEVRLQLSVDTPRPDYTIQPASKPTFERSASTVPIVIAVTDTGSGIAVEDQARVFDAFERGENGTTRVHGGTGLGLSISQKLARRMGGDIELTSQLGHGSTFRCHLLLEQDPAARTRQPARIPSPETSDILIDTDSTLMDATFLSTLRQHGIRCSLAAEVDPKDLLRVDRDRIGRQPRIWIVNPTSAERWSQLRRSGDRVIWVTRIGEAIPRVARDNDPLLIEPVSPDRLLQTIQEVETGPHDAPATSRKLRVNQDSPGSPPPQGPPHHGPSHGRVLLVDDSEVNRIVIRDLLAREGFDVDVAADGQEAIRCVSQSVYQGKAADGLAADVKPTPSRPEQPYDCILMDLQMPDMDGSMVARRIRQMLQRLGKASPPIVALTAHVTDEHRRLCAEAGMDGFLTKPIHPTRLIAELRLRIPDPPHAFPRVAISETTMTSPDQPHSTDPLPNNDITPSEKLEDGASEDMNEGASPKTSVSQWRERMKSHGGNQPEIVVSLCDAFLSEVPMLLRQLRSAVEKQDLKRLRIAAHTLKSCLRYVADEQDVAVAAEIEANAMTPDQVSSQQLEQVEAIAGLWTERVRQLRGEQQTEVER